MKALIKLGGTLAEDASLLRNVAAQIVAAQAAGISLCVVHGGGRQLTRALQRRGIESRFLRGLRITGPEAIQTVAEVLGGCVNTEVVAAIRAAGGSAVGLSGVDAHLTTASQLSPELGAVGNIDRVDRTLHDLLCSHGHIPVIACIAGDDKGAVYNVNADRMASACATAFEVDKLIFLTDVTGVKDEDGNCTARLSIADIRALIAGGAASGGMEAKLEASIGALYGGIASITIASGAEPEVLAQIFDGTDVGTQLVL